MDDGIALLLTFAIGFIIGVPIITVAVNIWDSHAIRTDNNYVLNNLDQHQINEITAYLKTNYPDNIVQNSNEKTTIIYVYQNGTQPKGCGV